MFENMSTKTRSYTLRAQNRSQQRHQNNPVLLHCFILLFYMTPLQNLSRQCSVHVVVVVVLIILLSLSPVLVSLQLGVELPCLSVFLFVCFSSQAHLQSRPLKAACVSSDVFHNHFFKLTSSELCITSLIGIPTNKSTLGWILNKIVWSLRTPQPSLSPHHLINTRLHVWILLF